MAVVFWIVKSVVCAVIAGELKSTSKYGSSSVAAGRTEMSQESSLFVVAGPAASAEIEKNNVASVPRQRIAENLGVKYGRALRAVAGGRGAPGARPPPGALDRVLGAGGAGAARLR